MKQIYSFKIYFKGKEEPDIYYDSIIADNEDEAEQMMNNKYCYDNKYLGSYLDSIDDYDKDGWFED